AIIILLLGANIDNSMLLQVGTIFMLIATMLTLYSGADYLYKNKELFMNSK
ncbi:MAG TPA: CDP-diacylglycerol--glycerol-3-phosphate 3-phosphatidyltransferase, partial [Terrisporobacter glycolicus]|nr:CDP-diacylglycerol--glycerol-3-phosphate 3-phosphatidyltransferase [Terrisporobacter hibernicus]